jgi:hypothetical protein
MSKVKGLVIGMVMMLVGIGTATLMLDNQLQRVIKFSSVPSEIGFTTLMLMVGIMGFIFVLDVLKENKQK